MAGCRPYAAQKVISTACVPTAGSPWATGCRRYAACDNLDAVKLALMGRWPGLWYLAPWGWTASVARSPAVGVRGSYVSPRYQVRGQRPSSCSKVFRRKSRGPQPRRSALRSPPHPFGGLVVIKSLATMTLPAEKLDSRLMRRMFGTIAPRYDFITRAFSYGMDGRWKRLGGEQASFPKHATVLDLACGTGDFSQLVLAAVPGAHVVALDLTEQMLRQARRRGLPEVVCGDAGALPLCHGMFDGVLVGYCLRN